MLSIGPAPHVVLFPLVGLDVCLLTRLLDCRRCGVEALHSVSKLWLYNILTILVYLAKVVCKQIDEKVHLIVIVLLALLRPMLLGGLEGRGLHLALRVCVQVLVW